MERDCRDDDDGRDCSDIVATAAAGAVVVTVVVVIAGIGRRFFVSNLEYTLSQGFPRPTAARQLIRSSWP